MLTPKIFQERLRVHGFNIGSTGADGIWGPSTERATEAWFDTGVDLEANPVTPEPGNEDLLAAGWLPDCDMDRVIVHWTAGSYVVSPVDKEHYHFIVGGDLKVYRGDNSIKANVSTSDADGYAAHTRGCNSRSIGISAACMLNAVESPFNAGKYPLMEGQWLVLASIAAQCCKRYGIVVSSKTVLQHGEVEKNLGIPQNGKWDINKLPWLPGLTPVEVHEKFRSAVRARM